MARLIGRMSSGKPAGAGQSGALVAGNAIMMLTWVLCITLVCTVVFGKKLVGEWSDLSGVMASLNQTYHIGSVSPLSNKPLPPECRECTEKFNCCCCDNGSGPTRVDTEAECFSMGGFCLWNGADHSDQQDFCDQSATCGVRICQPPAPEGP